MEFLGLLLQLVEAPLGVNVYGILCDLALLVISAHARKLAHKAACSSRDVGSHTMLNFCLTVCGACDPVSQLLQPVQKPSSHAYPDDALCQALPTHRGDIRVVLLAIDRRYKYVQRVGMCGHQEEGAGSAVGLWSVWWVLWCLVAPAYDVQ